MTGLRLLRCRLRDRCLLPPRQLRQPSDGVGVESAELFARASSRSPTRAKPTDLLPTRNNRLILQK